MDEETQVPEIFMPERVPVVMSGEGVGQLFEATKDFITETTRPELAILETPEGGKMPLFRNPGGELERVPQNWLDEADGEPKFRKGVANFTRLESFIQHVNKFGDPHSGIFVNDGTTPSLVAVLDYNVGDEVSGEGKLVGNNRFGWHRSQFAFPLSPEWRTWQMHSSNVMKMADFAAFIEKNVGDIGLAEDDLPEETRRFVEMNGGKSAVADFSTLITLSRGLKVHENSNVAEAVNVSSGEGHIRFDVSHTSTIGNGVVKVPTMFFIAIPVFKGGAYYRIAASLRYRKTSDGLVFWFDLWRSDRVFDHAINEAVMTVGSQCQGAIYYGSPE